ncbi:hypothetical protein [Paraliobacillus sediminis]|uniref:hypothetical protein n=1 Tax=Paraliobacillus sediminis TaxID=1885916 RepID=UPI0019673E96|nr:hypothetical protein [Paraliobacillus sediminis]
MNVKGLLERVFDRTIKENAIEIMNQRIPNWKPDKKNPKKLELKEDFLSLVQFIKPDEIEDFVEMAVMSKTIGLPAYTYKLKGLDFLLEDENQENDLSETEVIDFNNVLNYPFKGKYLFTIEEVSDTSTELNMTIRLKEYAEVWRSGGVRNIDTLTAVYKINVILSKQKCIVTIFTGNHTVQDVISEFLAFVLKWPIQNYRITEITNQSYQIGNASFKAALFLDLISNRLQSKGILSKFKEIKFNTRNTRHKNEGIRNVTINGKNLLSSQLACEYITLGSDILSFKVDMTFEDLDFSALFFLKGNNLDILKIVVVGQHDDNFKQRVVDIIQQEYIDMCNNGMIDINSTKSILDQIYEKFTSGDKSTIEAIQLSTLNIIDLLAGNLDKFDFKDENVIDMIGSLYFEYKSILDNVGYDEIHENLYKLKELSGIEEETEFQIYDYDDNLDEIIDEDINEDLEEERSQN